MAQNMLEKIRSYLNDAGITFREVEHGPTRTSVESAAARGEDLSIGAKALLLRTDEVFRLFVLPADHKLDSTAIRRHLGVRRTRFASAEELHELVGLVPGSVPPFGEPIMPFELYADESLGTRTDKLAFNAGSLSHSIIMAASDWAAVARPKRFRFAVKATGDKTDADYAATIVAPAGDFANASEPFSLFETWLKEAGAHEINDPNAMALATVDADGLPNCRMVILHGLDPPNAGAGRGFVFYTNLESVKGLELLATGKAALLFHWKSLRRQIRLRGEVQLVSEAEADEYFAGRSRRNRIGVWASQQSRPLKSRFALEKAVAAQATKFNIGTVPRPPHWSGFRLVPVEIEFWHDRPFSLHERIDFRRAAAQDPWRKNRLFP